MASAVEPGGQRELLWASAVHQTASVQQALAVVLGARRILPAASRDELAEVRQQERPGRTAMEQAAAADAVDRTATLLPVVLLAAVSVVAERQSLPAEWLDARVVARMPAEQTAVHSVVRRTASSMRELRMATPAERPGVPEAVLPAVRQMATALQTVADHRTAKALPQPAGRAELPGVLRALLESRRVGCRRRGSDESPGSLPGRAAS